jgi:hypothetical protein
MFCIKELRVSVLSDHHQVRCYTSLLSISNYNFYANILHCHLLKLWLKFLYFFILLKFYFIIDKNVSFPINLFINCIILSQFLRSANALVFSPVIKLIHYFNLHWFKFVIMKSWLTFLGYFSYPCFLTCAVWDVMFPAVCIMKYFYGWGRVVECGGGGDSRSGVGVNRRRL